MNAKQALIDALGAGGLPVLLQGSVAPDEEYPPLFWTFWLHDAPEPSHYDNAPASCEWCFWAYCYGNDPAAVAREADEGRARLKNAGFALAGRPVDAPSDVKSHTGLMLDARILENYGESE